MDIHGVDEDGFLKKGTQIELLAAIKDADRVICY